VRCAADRAATRCGPGPEPNQGRPPHAGRNGAPCTAARQASAQGQPEMRKETAAAGSAIGTSRLLAGMNGKAAEQQRVSGGTGCRTARRAQAWCTSSAPSPSSPHAGTGPVRFHNDVGGEIDTALRCQGRGRRGSVGKNVRCRRAARRRFFSGCPKAAAQAFEARIWMAARRAGLQRERSEVLAAAASTPARAGVPRTVNALWLQVRKAGPGGVRCRAHSAS
jgi:hypothetical protein